MDVSLNKQVSFSSFLKIGYQLLAIEISLHDSQPNVAPKYREKKFSIWKKTGRNNRIGLQRSERKSYSRIISHLCKHRNNFRREPLKLCNLKNKYSLGSTT